MPAACSNADGLPGVVSGSDVMSGSKRGRAKGRVRRGAVKARRSGAALWRLASRRKKGGLAKRARKTLAG